MSQPTAYQPGQFGWIDLLTPDAAAATAFYQALFGWRTCDQGGVYTMFQQDGLNICGMGEMDEAMKQAGMPAVWNSYVTVDDADATASRVVELGGTVAMPVMQVMEAGRMAIFVDPAGARFSIWEAGEHHGADLVNEPNSLAWNELATRDASQAKAFYGQLFGWRFADLGNGYHEILVGERANGGIREQGPDAPEDPPFWLPYISVADCDATMAQLVSLGGTALMHPVDIDPGRFCLATDPQGALLTVMRIDNPE